MPIAHPIHQKTKTFGANDSLRDALLAPGEPLGSWGCRRLSYVGTLGGGFLRLKNMTWNVGGQKLDKNYSAKKLKVSLFVRLS